ncbi:MAG: helix-turn-helix transcriptional regulator [Chitinophagaceae bacterium]
MLKFLLPEELEQMITHHPLPPKIFKIFLIPGAEIHFSQGPAGIIQEQQIRNPQFTLWILHMHLIQPLKARLRVEKNESVLQFILKGSWEGKDAKTPSIPLAQGKYQFLSTGYLNSLNLLLPIGDQVSLHIAFPKNTLSQWFREYPELQNLFEPTLSGKSFTSHLQSFRINNNVRSILQQILNCRLEKAKRDLFLQSKINQLLGLYLEQIDRKNTNEVTARKNSLRIDELESYLVSSFSSASYENHPQVSTENLAHHFGIKKEAFRQALFNRYQVNLNQFLLQFRMKKAMEWITMESWSMERIAEELGYTDHANFSRAFKNYYGSPPSNFRQGSSPEGRKIKNDPKKKPFT